MVSVAGSSRTGKVTPESWSTSVPPTPVRSHPVISRVSRTTTPRPVRRWRSGPAAAHSSPPAEPPRPVRARPPRGRKPGESEQVRVVHGLEAGAPERLRPAVEIRGTPVQLPDLGDALPGPRQSRPHRPLVGVRNPVRHPERGPQQFLGPAGGHQRPLPQPAEGDGALLQKAGGTPLDPRDPHLDQAGPEPREIHVVRPRVIGQSVGGHRVRPVQPRALLAPRPRTARRHGGPQGTRVPPRPHAGPRTPVHDAERDPPPRDQRARAPPPHTSTGPSPDHRNPEHVHNRRTQRQ